MASQIASAGKILDFIRNYDLNDYALGVAITGTQSPYLGADRSVFFYPYLTSFLDIAFTDDWLIFSGGNVGARWVGKSGWVLGGVGRIKTHGTGSDLFQELLGVDTRQWTVEIAPLVGYRAWPVHFDFRHYIEVFGQHGGSTNELELSYPIDTDWGYLVPTTTLIRYDQDYTQYYYGVSSSDLLPGIPAYNPGASNGIEVGVRWGVEVTDSWLLSGFVGHEWFGTEIAESPIVDKDSIWSARIGLAYNADVFQSRVYDDHHHSLPKLEIRVGFFQDNIDSKMIRRPADGGPSEEIDLEDVLGVDSRENVFQIEGMYRFTPFHRLEFGHFELGRDSNVRLETDLEIGDQIFPEGSEVTVQADANVTRIAYSFSLMNDAQKELGVMAGVHVTKISNEIFSSSPDQYVASKLSAPLPVIGTYGNISLGENTKLGAVLQMFRMEFDHYAGSLNFLYLGLQHSFTDHIGAGLGYSYYDLNLDSNDDSVRGTLRLKHHGPSIFAAFYF